MNQPLRFSFCFVWDRLKGSLTSRKSCETPIQSTHLVLMRTVPFENGELA